MPAKQSFQELQEGLARWSVAGDQGGTIIAVPSLSLPYFGTPEGKGLAHYEERIFYLVHFLKNPLNRLIIITSKAVAETLVSYLLHLLPGVPHSHARRRLQLLSVQDDSAKPLTQKILERPRLLDRVRCLVKDQPRVTLSCYTVTELEERLAEELQIPVYGPSAEHLKLATKSVARNIFRDLDLTLAEGGEHLSSAGDFSSGVLALARALPELKKAVLKQNYSLAGLGNAIVDLSGLRELLSAEQEPEAVLEAKVLDALPTWVSFDDSDQSWSPFWHRLLEGGGAVEEFIDGDPCSVQVRIAASGEVEVIATHDEISEEGEAEREGQAYVASRMPAAPRVAKKLAEAGLRVGERLAELGVVGRFDVDFLASPRGGERLDRLYALDINLRKGHTTLPIRTLQALSGGHYDAEAGVFRGGSGKVLCYRTSDHFGAGMLHGLLPRDLLEIITSAGLHYSSATGTGALFHMLGAMSQRGKTGITCIAHSHAQADEISETVLKELMTRRGGYDWIT